MGMSEKKEMLIKLGKQIAKIRRNRGLTIEKLAYEAGISKGNLSDIENGNRDARYSSLYAIAENLDISISQLLKDL